MTNPYNLPTFTDVISTERDLSDAFEIKVRPTALHNLGVTLHEQKRAFNIAADHERITFDVFPGLGRVAITCTFIEDGIFEAPDQKPQYTRTPAFQVVITHPAMGRGRGEVHLCTDTEQVLAVLATVSYGWADHSAPSSQIPVDALPTRG